MPQNRGCWTRVDPWRLVFELQELQGPLVQLLFPYKGSNGARERGLRSWRWRRHPGASACRGRPADMGLQVLLLFAWLGCWTLNLNLSPKTKQKIQECIQQWKPTFEAIFFFCFLDSFASPPSSGISRFASSVGIGLAPGIRLSGAFAVFIT